MSEVEFGPLPKIKGGGRRHTGKWPGHQQVARDLAAKPGEWAKVAHGMKSHAAARVASLINKGEADGFDDTVGIFKASTRRNEEGSYDVWAQAVEYRPPTDPPVEDARAAQPPIEIHHATANFTATGG